MGEEAAVDNPNAEAKWRSLGRSRMRLRLIVVPEMMLTSLHLLLPTMATERRMLMLMNGAAGDAGVKISTETRRQLTSTTMRLVSTAFRMFGI